MSGPGKYADRRKTEIEAFRDVTNVHALPEIFHHWSGHHLAPLFNDLGITGVYEFFAAPMLRALAEPPRPLADTRPWWRRVFGQPVPACHRFVSLGAGNCETEIAIVELLVKAGHRGFRFDCIDLNPHMVARGRELAEQKGLADLMTFQAADVEGWRFTPGEFDVVMAHQSLHHFVELETLFDKISEAIGDHGVFVTSDIIGRNGHMRWPEALEVVHEIWREMPDRYKYNHILKRFEPLYENWDCSTAGFEGIRAQDILPLLVQRFRFELFLAFGNLIDIFVDRAFGHNFDPASAEDRAFIDRVATLDQKMIEEGTLKPTHLFAVMRNGAVAQPRIYRHLTPEFCIRPVAAGTTQGS